MHNHDNLRNSAIQSEEIIFILRKRQWELLSRINNLRNSAIQSEAIIFISRE